MGFDLLSESLDQNRGGDGGINIDIMATSFNLLSRQHFFGHTCAQNSLPSLCRVAKTNWEIAYYTASFFHQRKHGLHNSNFFHFDTCSVCVGGDAAAGCC